MNKNYKLIISGRNVYKEIVLGIEDKKELRIGTEKGCNIRLRKELFFDAFVFKVYHQNNQWYLEEENNIFFTINEVIKVSSKLLQHGDEVFAKTQKQNAELFKLQFVIDFESEERNYERKISLKERNNVTIGTEEHSNIYLKDELLKHENIALVQYDGRWQIEIKETQFGIYLNGTKIESNQKIEEYSFIGIGPFRFYYKEDALYIEKSEKVYLNGIVYEDIVLSKSHLEYPDFTRNTRIIYELPNKRVKILQPQNREEKPKKDIVMQILPLMLSLAMIVLLQSTMSVGGHYLAFTLGTSAISIIMVFVNIVNNKKEYREKETKRNESFRSYIKEKENVLRELQKKEKELLEHRHVNLEESIRIVEEFDKRLFEKEEEHPDYLVTRIGTGKIESGYQIEVTEQEQKVLDDDLQEIPLQVKEAYTYQEDAPVFSNLKECDAIGIVGKKQWLWEFGKNVTIDIAARHYYNKVKFCYIFEGEEVEKFSWVRWLQHVNSVQGNVRNIVYDDITRSNVLEFLYTELINRSSKEERSKKHVSYLVFIFDTVRFLEHPVSKYIKDASKYGVTFLFFVEHEEFLPSGCSEVIRLFSEHQGEQIIASQGQKVQEFSYNSVPDSVADMFSKKISPICIKEPNLDSQLTKNITLFQLLKIYSADEIDYHKNWETSKVYETMAAPIGVKAKNEKIYLDLHEKFHGPHGLVAGTTGSGKSEVLQTYILSMAIRFHPHDVGFVLIDFKGGGMLNQFRNLPHLAGTITNIDGKEIERSLKSIKAELRKRQEIFSEYQVNHIDQYIKLYKKGETVTPVPHLIIIVDEFAELKAEFPDFMQELISAARIGRSLGVHLILATQKPSGVVDDQIWSNSKFKICLKVQDKSDSNEMIKVGLAAEIREPGRGYFQVGNNEIFELFQSAYSGASIKEDAGKPFEIALVDFAGRRKVIFSNKEKKEQEQDKNQLTVIVEEINQHCRNHAISQVPSICLESLKDIIYLSNIEKPIIDIEKGICIHIGIYDDPDYQIQAPVSLNISKDNTYIIGASQSGKTTLLQTILFGMINEYTPEEVNIYILDFGTMSLKVFEKSNHVGGVILPPEEEKLKNLFKLLREEIEKRKNILLEKGIGTFTAYKEAGYRELPQIIVMIDNYVNVKEYQEQYVEEIEVLAREGQSIGISLIITGSQGTGIGYKMQSNFGNRISMFQNDKSDYNNIFDYCRIEPKNTPGRGLVLLQKRILEFQAALCVEAEKEHIRNQKISEFIKRRNNTLHGKYAKYIPQVPSVLLEEDLERYGTSYDCSALEVPIGLDFDEIKVQSIVFLKTPVVSVMGRSQGGKTNLIKYCVKYLINHYGKEQVDITIFDSKQKQLEELEKNNWLINYYTDIEPIGSVLEELQEELEQRRNLFYDDVNSIEKKPLKLLILENSDVVDRVARNSDFSEIIETIVEEFNRFRVCIFFGNLPNMSIGYSAPDVYKIAKETSCMIMFESLEEQKYFDFTRSERKMAGKIAAKGDAFMGNEDKLKRVRTVKYE